MNFMSGNVYGVGHVILFEDDTDVLDSREQVILTVKIESTDASPANPAVIMNVATSMDGVVFAIQQPGNAVRISIDTQYLRTKGDIAKAVGTYFETLLDAVRTWVDDNDVSAWDSMVGEFTYYESDSTAQYVG